MASTFVNDLRLEEIGSGEQSGTWGDTTNTNLELIAEAFSFGTEAIPTNVTNSVHTTTIANGATDPGRSIFLRYTGSQNVAVTVTIGPPTVSKLWFIENATSGSSVNLIIKQGSGATVTIPAGQTKAIYSNGAGTGAAMVDAFATLNVVDLLVDDDLTVTDDVAIGGLATVGGTLAVTGIATFTDDIIIGDGKTIGSASDVDAMSISSGGVVNFSARPTFAASLTIQDGGSLGSASDLNAMTISSGGVVAVTATTASSSPTTGALTVGGGLGVAADLFVGDDFDVAGDAVIDLTCLVTGILTTTAGTVFNGGFAANAGSSITRDDNGAQLTLISTDTDASSGPVLDLYRNSGNAIDGDNIGQINFYGENTSDQKHQYLYLFSEILDATAGTEDVRFVIGGLVAGADSSLFEYTSTAGSGDDPELVFNKTSRNINFRVKSSGNANALFVDGGNSRIGIGIATPSTPLEVNGIATMDSARLSSNSGTSYWDIRRDSSTGHFVIKDDGLGDVLTIRQDTGNIAVTGIIATNTLGTDNVRLGENAGEAIVSGGDRNIVIGKNAGQKITGGDSNVAIGWEALKKETARSNNIAIGASALTDQESDQDAYNVAVGYHAGKVVSTGVFNTLVGSLCYDNLTLGDLHTAIGYNLGPSAVDVSSEIIIGSNVNGAGTNQVRIGLASGSATLSLDGNDTSWSASSDSRLKTDVATCAVGLDFIKALRPITYKWEAKNAVANTLPQYDADSSDPVYGSGKIQHGFLAQEVKTAIDAHSGLKNGFTMWREDPDGTQQVAPTALVPMLVKAIQELEARIAVLEG